MSQTSVTDSGNASRAPAPITEIIGSWVVPSADEGLYQVVIRAPYGDQLFSVSAGDIISKERVPSARALVHNPSNPPNPSDTRYISVYPDDVVCYEHLNNQGEPVTTQEHLRDMNIHATGPMSVKLHTDKWESAMHADRPLADLEHGSSLMIRRVPQWYVGRQPFVGQQPEDDSIKPYLLGILGPHERVGWVKRSENTTRDVSTIEQSNAVFRDQMGRRV